MQSFNKITDNLIMNSGVTFGSVRLMESCSNVETVEFVPIVAWNNNLPNILKLEKNNSSKFLVIFLWL